MLSLVNSPLLTVLMLRHPNLLQTTICDSNKYFFGLKLCDKILFLKDNGGSCQSQIILGFVDFSEMVI